MESKVPAITSQPTATLTKRLIDGTLSGPRDTFVWDDEVPRGFGLKLTSAGRKIFSRVVAPYNMLINMEFLHDVRLTARRQQVPGLGSRLNPHRRGVDRGSCLTRLPLKALQKEWTTSVPPDAIPAEVWGGAGSACFRVPSLEKRIACFKAAGVGAAQQHPSLCLANPLRSPLSTVQRLRTDVATIG